MQQPYASVTNLQKGVEVKILKSEDFGLNIKGFKKRTIGQERAASIDVLMDVNNSNNNTHQTGFSKDTKFQ